MDPLQFLKSYPPFDALSEAGLALVAASVEISFVAEQTLALTQGGEPATHLFVVRKGAVALERDGENVDELGVGEAFGFPSLLGRCPPAHGARAIEDCLLCRLPAATFHALVATEPPFRDFFVAELAQRLRATPSRTKASALTSLTRPIREIALDSVAIVQPSATILEVAARMRSEDHSAVLIGTTDTPAHELRIVTDRDLRNKVVATGLELSLPISTIASNRLVVLDESSSLFDALALMTQHHIHHVPIVRSQGKEPTRVCGLITDDGVLREHMQSPGLLLSRIDRAPIGEAPPKFSQHVAQMVSVLHRSGLAGCKIGEVVAAVNDALFAKICSDAENQLGPPPVPYAWIAFGSEGRREQALVTDQDNALVYGDAETTELHANYFQAFAKLVIDAVIRGGIPPCKGGYMATQWNHSLSQWCRLFAQWGHAPEPQAMMHAANLFDFRKVHGTLELSALEDEVNRCADNPRFMAHMAKQVLALRPQIGLFGRIGDRDRHLDLKANAIGPLVGLARMYALRSHERQGSTLDRIRNAAAKKLISEDLAATLNEAFSYVFEMRLNGQVEAIGVGDEPSNTIELDQISSLDRRHLKEILVTIRDAQVHLETTFRVHSLG
jgi:CBS domain-containing protein